MLRIFLYLPAVLLLLFNSCAMRDNEHDPLSPLHKPPTLAVALGFDSTLATIITSDSISVDAPFNLTINAKSSDFFIEEEASPITFRHYFNNSLIAEVSNFLNDTFTLRTKGVHTFSFSSVAENGAKSEQNCTINVVAPVQPRITSFTLSYDTLPIKTKQAVSLYIEITDKALIADSIVFAISKVAQPVHHIKKPKVVYKDTLTVHDFYGFCEENDTLTVYLFDRLGRIDTLSKTITFSKNKKIIHGFAPVIDSVFIAEKPPLLYIDQTFKFSSSAHDADSNINSYRWDFGDSTSSSKASPSHAFSKVGNYSVTLTITDDSTNTTSKSMSVEIVKKEVIKPTFTRLTLSDTLGPAPFTTTISVEADDKDGHIHFIKIYVNLNRVDFIKKSEVSKVLTFDLPGTYYLEIIAEDDTGNFCREIRKIIVTAPESNTSKTK